MFCTNLRKRPEFAPILPSLLSSKAPQWRGSSPLLSQTRKTNPHPEKTLETHDIALSLPRGDTQPDYFRLLLLSASDSEPLERIERIFHLTGGRQVGVVFLLKEQFSKGKRNGMVAYLNLQARFVTATLVFWDISTQQQNLTKSQRTASSHQHSNSH